MLPAVIAHADWGVNPEKRWMAMARREGDSGYRMMGVNPVSESLPFFHHLKSFAGEPGPVLVGFDFPIGLPIHYARLAGIEDFLSWLPGLGSGKWAEFFDVAERPEQISLGRPFYPKRNNIPAGEGGPRVRQVDLLDAHRAGHTDQLRRLCEKAHSHRRAASPLFWTVGAQQVGKAALSGWKEILLPGLADPTLHLKLWPFSGRLVNLLDDDLAVAVETYPAEFYHQLGIRFTKPRRGEKSGKRVQSEREANAPALLACLSELGHSLETDLRVEIEVGFGPDANGEDRFDAFIGLVGMLKTIRQLDIFPEPEDQNLLKIEGWIFGQALPMTAK